MNLPINKQTILITGAGRGLGSEIAKSFYREGAKVIINYRKSFESAKKLCISLGERAVLVQGDVRNKDDVLKIKDELKNKTLLLIQLSIMRLMIIFLTATREKNR
jgi:Dehydrogenases with different specificities (related to short-chain alcohol dehydrogenases)